MRASAGRRSPRFELLVARTRGFVARVSRESCVTRQHRRQIRALSYYAHSSCIARQGSPFRPGLSCYAGFLGGCDGVRLPEPFPSAVKRADANHGCCRS